MNMENGNDSREQRSKYRNGHTATGLPIRRFSILLALLASMGGFIFGYELGQVVATLSMSDFQSRFGQCYPNGSCYFTNIRSGLLIGLFSIGTLIGVLLGAPATDFLGRRNAMSLGCGAFILGTLIQITSFRAWYQVAIGRLVSGLGAGALSVAVPVYQAETAPTQIRGALTGTYELFIGLGTLVAYCISIGTRKLSNSEPWRIVIGIDIVFAVLLGIATRVIPESPHWSLVHRSPRVATQAVARMYALPEGHPIVSSKVKEMAYNADIEVQMDKEGPIGGARLEKGTPNQKSHSSSKVHWFKGCMGCFKGFRAGSSRLGYRTLLGMALQSLHQLTGRNYFFYYGETVFQSVGYSDSFVVEVILGSIDVGSTLLGLFVMERFGRRRPLIIGGVWQGLWLFVFAATGTVKNPMYDEGVGKLMIVSMSFFILGYGTTWGPGIWIVIGETFPTRERAIQSALSTASNWFWNFLIAFFTPSITSEIGFRYVFVFASCNLLGSLIVYFFLYESAGMPLEMVDLMYRDASVTPRTSRRWYPHGHKSEAAVYRGHPKRPPPDGLNMTAKYGVDGVR